MSENSTIDYVYYLLCCSVFEARPRDVFVVGQEGGRERVLHLLNRRGSEYVFDYSPPMLVVVIETSKFVVVLHGTGLKSRDHRSHITVVHHGLCTQELGEVSVVVDVTRPPTRRLRLC